MIVAFVDDLMLLSRVREAARALDVEVRGMRRVSDLVEACRHSPTVVLIDLDSARLPGRGDCRAQGRSSSGSNPDRRILQPLAPRSGPECAGSRVLSGVAS
jgi:hypothetical protein